MESRLTRLRCDPDPREYKTEYNDMLLTSLSELKSLLMSLEACPRDGTELSAEVRAICAAPNATRHNANDVNAAQVQEKLNCGHKVCNFLVTSLSLSFHRRQRNKL